MNPKAQKNVPAIRTNVLKIIDMDDQKWYTTYAVPFFIFVVFWYIKYFYTIAFREFIIYGV